MSFIEKNLVTLGGQLKRGDVFQTFGYLTTGDDKVTVLASGYFNEAKESLTRNDVIKVIDKTVSPTETYEVIVTALPLVGDVEVTELIIGSTGGLIYRGIINVAADFPTTTDVQNGDLYVIGTNVTDNDPTKTNTGQSFLAGDEIFWNGTDWTVLGASELWKRTGDLLEPFNAGDRVRISPADGAADPLFCVQTTGTNQYGFCIETLDLTGIGAGKYPYFRPLTNGLASNLGVFGSLIIGDSYPVGFGFGQALGFLRESDVASMLISANWDGGGVGIHQMVFNDDVVFQQDCTVNGTLSAGTLSLANLSIGQNTSIRPTITFDALNNDGSLVYHDSGGGVPVRWELHSSTNASDVWVDRHISNYNNSLEKIGFTNNNDEGIIYTEYKSNRGSENPDFTAHSFSIVGTQMAANAWAMRIFHMSDPGYIFRIDPFGSLVLGSATSGTDRDVTITFYGGAAGNDGLLTWDQSADQFVFSDDILMSGTERIYLNDANSYIYDDGTRVLIGCNDAQEKIGLVMASGTAYLGVYPTGGWMSFGGAIAGVTDDNGLQIYIPLSAGGDFYYGYGGTESHLFGNTGTEFTISSAGVLSGSGAWSTTSTIQATSTITSLTAFRSQGNDTVTVPGYSWTGDTDTGMYHPSAGVIGFTCNGVEKGRFEANIFKTTVGKVEKTTRLTATTTLAASDHIVFCDTDGGAFTVNLPAGVEGTNYKIINCGSSGNDLTVDPNGTEQLFGAGAGVASTVSDGEVIDIHYNATEGWW